MGYRNLDWECPCGDKREALVWVPHGEPSPASAAIECETCGHVTDHERRMSLPAAYLGEKPYAPKVYGGRFDTMGLAPLPPRGHPDRERVKALNAEKKQRAAAMKRDPNIDLRTNPLPGDPKRS
jgi:hypothetical protein